MYSRLIATADPTPFNKPRFISWPSVCDTTRTNWLGPDAPDPAPPLPALQNHVEYADMWGRHSCLPDERVLAACSSIDCIAAPADPSLTFTAIAAPPSVSADLYTTLICAAGVPGPAPPKPRSAPADSPQKPKKRGRKAIFDEAKRAEFIGMLKAGFTIRYAARRVGVSHVAVLQARDRDAQFATRITEAQRDRDLHCIRRIHNAGKKSWRAAAWLLERVEPQEFSLQHKNRDPRTARGQRRLKNLITEIVDSRLADHPKTGNRDGSVNPALRLIEDRLAEIESQYDPYDDSDDEETNDDSDAYRDRGGVSPMTDHGERGGVSPPITDDEVDHDELHEDEMDDDNLDEDEPDEDYQENNGYESEQAAVDAYRQALRKLNVRNLDIEAEVEGWRQQLRKFNARLRQRRQRC